MGKLFFAVLLLSAFCVTANAADIAIVQGYYYTSNLRIQLESSGHTVTEIVSYDATTLAPYDLVIHYGNTFTDTAELELYVQGGGNLLLTPWAGDTFAIPDSLRAISIDVCEQYSEPYPGISVLAPDSELLTGVSFPANGSPFNIGRFCNATFEPLATGILNWADGPAMLGVKPYGSGYSLQLNMHIVTSDTAYDVIDQPWAAQLVSNIANFSTLPPGAPPAAVVTNVSPTSGPVAGGTVVTLTGSGFTGASALTFAGVPAASFTVDSDTQITATTPAGAAGPAAIGITTPISTVESGSFTYLAEPAEVRAVPALGQLGLIMMSLLMAMTALIGRRRKLLG